MSDDLTTWVVFGPQDCEGVTCGYQIAGRCRTKLPDDALKQVAPEYYGAYTFPGGSYLVVPLDAIRSFEIDLGPPALEVTGVTREPLRLSPSS